MSTATLHTNHGAIAIELFDDDAPKTVDNFVKLARDGFYDGVIFHRVIPDFMTASVTESQVSPPGRPIETTAEPDKLRPRICCGLRPSASLAGTPVACSAARFQRTTSPSRSTATIPSAMFSRIAEFRSFSRATRW